MYQNDAIVQNELDINDLLVKLFKLTFLIFPLLIILKAAGIFRYSWIIVSAASAGGMLSCLLPVVYRQLRIDSRGLKYISVACTVLLAAICYIYLQSAALLVWLIPMGFALLYSDGALIRRALVMDAAAFASAEAVIRLADIRSPQWTGLEYAQIGFYVLQVLVTALIFTSSARRTAKMLHSTQSLYENINDLFSNTYAATESLQLADSRLMQSIEDAEEVHGDNNAGKTAVKSIITNINKTVENARELMKYTQAAILASKDGNAGVRELAEEMKKIDEYTAKSKNALLELSRYTEKIKQDLSLMSIIIDESKLISLNAAREAENASSGGKGSAIVAMKVEKLADESVNSAEHIHGVLSDVVSNAENAVKSVAETYEDVIKSLELINRTVETLIKWLMYKNMK